MVLGIWRFRSFYLHFATNDWFLMLFFSFTLFSNNTWDITPSTVVSPFKWMYDASTTKWFKCKSCYFEVKLYMVERKYSMKWSWFVSWWISIVASIQHNFAKTIFWLLSFYKHDSVFIHHEIRSLSQALTPKIIE